MIAHALKILCTKQQMSAKGYPDRPFHHVSEKLSKETCAQPVNLLVSLPNVNRLGDITARETVKNIVQLSQNKSSHVGDPAH